MWVRSCIILNNVAVGFFFIGLFVFILEEEELRSFITLSLEYVFDVGIYE